MDEFSKSASTIASNPIIFRFSSVSARKPSFFAPGGFGNSTCSHLEPAWISTAYSCENSHMSAEAVLLYNNVPRLWNCYFLQLGLSPNVCRCKPTPKRVTGCG